MKCSILVSLLTATVILLAPGVAYCCATEGDPDCPAGTTCNFSENTCDPCGGPGQACCQNSCNTGLYCQLSGQYVNSNATANWRCDGCGGVDQVCCGSTCNGNLQCISGVVAATCRPGLHPFVGRVAPDVPEVQPMTSAQIAELFDRRRKVRNWATVNLCGHTVYTDRTVDYDDHSDCPLNGGTWSCGNTGRDSNLIHGLLCASGEPFFCESVRQAQDATGKWWRSPLAAVTQCLQTPQSGWVWDAGGSWASFSRDHSVGSLLYLAATRDTEAASRWSAYMAHPQLYPLAVINRARELCHDDFTLTGDFCSLWSPQGTNISDLQNSSEFLGLFRDVFTDLGLHTTSDMDEGAKNAVNDRAYYACRGASSATFRTMLVSYEYLLDQINLGRKRNVNFKSHATGEECIASVGSDPLLKFVREGASREVADLVLSSCPVERPPFPFQGSSRAGWQWGSIGWTQPGGWDCILMMNLLLGPDPDASRWEQIYATAPDFGSFSFVYTGAFAPVLLSNL